MTASVTYQGNSYYDYYGEYSGSVIIPETVIYNGTTYSVTSIGEAAFSDCSSLTSVSIPNSVTSIGYRTFYGCSALTSITIPESITSIGSAAFSGCESITKTNYIGDIAGWCKIKFGNATTNPIYYSHNLYINDQEIKDLVIPNTVDSIQNYAFYECFSLNSVTIPNSVKSIGYDTFQNCCFLKKDFVNNSSLDAEEKGYWGALVGESEVDGLIIQGTTVVGCRKNVTAVTIPNNITNIGNYAFAGCSSLTSITIPKSVTSVGSYVFDGCDALTKTNYTGDIAGWCDIEFDSWSSNPMSYSQNLYINDQEIKDLVIPNSVDSIHDYAFYNGSALSSVSLSNSVTSIGNYAFAGCESITKTNYTGDIAGWCDIKFDSSRSNPMFYSQNLYINDQEIKDLVIPNSVDSIHDYAFYNGSALSTVSLSNSVTSIGYAAFEGCSSLTSITIPNSVTSIGYAAFEGCSSLTSITIPNSVTSIGNDAFSRCSSLSSVTIPNSVTSIGNNAFYNCSSLTSVILSEGLTSIGNWAFFSCSSLTSITIPDNVTYIGYWAFDNTGIYNDESNWENNELYIDDCLIAIKFSSLTGSYTIKDGVRLIAGGAFWEQYGLTEVIIPNSVKSISTRAFSNTEITSIVIPNSVTNIEQMTFYNCRNLSTVTLGSGLKCIEDRVFDGCSALTSINIPKGVSGVGKWAFRQCSSLDTIFLTSQIPPTLDATAFQNAAQPICYVPCGTLAEYQASSWVNYVDTLVEVCDNELFYTSTDGAIVTPDNTAFGAKIVDNTYSNGQCVITFDRPILTIKQSAFSSCDNLATIMIPKTVTEIEDYAFKYCSALSSIIIPNNITTIGKGTFSGCSALTEVNIPNNVTRIEENTFSGCSALTEIAIPNSVTYIGESAFEDCIRLGKVQIGSGVETIAENAFAGCRRLYDVYCYATYPPFAEQSSFANYNVYLYVPCESIRNYTLDVVWGNFKFIECIESEDVTTEGVVVTPSTNDVTITWPTEAGADSYTIVIKKGDTVFCTLTFNADGQLLNIAFAPGRNGNHPAQYAEQAGNGYRFTVTGLEEGTHYAYNIDVKDAADKTIKSYTGEFTTESVTSVENIHGSSSITNCQKMIRNGQFVIVRDGVEYTIMGQEL